PLKKPSGYSGSLDRLQNQLTRFMIIAPAVDPHPLAVLQVLVALEEVGDLPHSYLGQVAIADDLLVPHRHLAGRHRDQFLVLTFLVPHPEHADGTAIDDAAWNKRTRVGDQHVDRITVL